MHTIGMRHIRCITSVLALLLASTAMRSRGQTAPDLTGEEKFEQRAIRTLTARPAIAVFGIVSLEGATTSLTNRLTNASVRDAAELILRRNGISIAPSCEGGTGNCGKLGVWVVATCTKTDLVDHNDRFCALYVRIQYLENVYSSRTAPGINPSVEFSYREFCPVWEEPFFPVATTDKLLEDKARKSWTQALEKFSLQYLRANPSK